MHFLSPPLPLKIGNMPNHLIQKKNIVRENLPEGHISTPRVLGGRTASGLMRPMASSSSIHSPPASSSQLEERGQIVLPIYHHVEPSEVRRQHREYGQAFQTHIKRNADRVETWRKALMDASNLLGWETAAVGKESVCIKQVVDAISNRLFPNEDLIGLQNVAHMKIPLRKLTLATENFSKEYVISKGGLGTVYKTQFQHATVAVKKLDPSLGQERPVMSVVLKQLEKALRHQQAVSQE
ncbi:hypothetical protein L1887_15488 [Cichorium endivia]|nr:hypothetical protein L1887_15488 [Cichorium endivia]